jgi:hypothetical protein
MLNDVEKAEREGFDAITVSCIYTMRETLNVRVVRAVQSALHSASLARHIIFDNIWWIYRFWSGYRGSAILNLQLSRLFKL